MRFFWFGILISLFSSSFGQVFMPYIQNYGPENYGSNLNPENYAIAQNSEGFMFFGTAHGVLSFDGQSWQHLKVKEGAFVTALKEKNGIIYVGTLGEFGKLEVDAQGKYIYQKLSSDQGLNENSMVWAIGSDDEAIYFHTEEAIFKLNINHKDIQTIRPKSSFHTMLESDDMLVARDRSLGLTALNKTGVDFTSLKDISTYGVFVFEQIHKGYFIATRDSGFYFLNSKNQLSRPLKQLEKHLEGALISSGHKLNPDELIINTIGKGSVIVNLNTYKFKWINQYTGIGSSDVNASFQDQNGDLWLATNKGVSFVKYSTPIAFHGSKQGVQGSVFSHLYTDSLKLMGTSDGIFEWDGEKNKWNNIRDNVGTVWDIAALDKGFIYGTSEGLFHSKKGRILNKAINAVILKNNQIITGGPEGIFILSANNFGVLKRFEFPISTINSFEFDLQQDHLLWIGTFQDGILQLNTKNWELDFYTESDGLPSGSWTRVFSGNKQSLFSTNTGVFRFVSSLEISRNNEGMDSIRGYFDAYLPFAGKPYQFAIENEYGKWAVLESELLQLDSGDIINNPYKLWTTGRINRIGTSGSTVVFDATEGLLLMDAQSIHPSTLTTPYWKYIISNKDTLVRNHFGKFQLKKDLEYQSSKLKIQFGVLDYDQRSTYLFSYRIVGSLDEWTDWSEQQFVQIDQLFEGDYTLEVRCKDRFGRISQYPKLTFRILPPWYRTTWAYILYILLVIGLILIVIPLARYRLKKKNEQLEEIVQERTKEISTKNVALEKQKNEIELQKEEILDSINYALRIQNAILPFDELISQHLPDSFVFFQPKDIVSGDFYWFHHEDNMSVFVCADCTGHGVPGAFMSMIGSDKLNTIVREKKIFDPGKILSELNIGIKNSLKQSGEEGSTKDGMDAAICTILHHENKVLYAGANRNLNYIENGEIYEIKASKAAVAGFTDWNQLFETHEIEQASHKYFYMTTDGYPDQFGGDKGKKLKMKFYKEVILNHHKEAFPYQKQALNAFMIDWMQDYEQIDDMCVIGFKPNE